MPAITSNLNPLKSGLGISEEQLVASLCRDDFYFFVQEFWDIVVPEKPVWNWHIKYICDELQIVAERIFKGKPKYYDLVINIPPGMSKSTICSVMFPVWVWIRMPSFRSICGSYAHPLALDLSRKSRDVVRSEKFRTLFPHIEMRKDQDTKAYFANTKGGARYSVGSGGSITGMHGHALIIDDPIDPAMAMSDADLKNINEWMNETLSQRKVDKAVTPLILIMQRLHQNDPSGVRLKMRGKLKHICLPAILTDKVNPPELKKFYVRGLLDPRRLNKKTLKEARSYLGTFGYAGQMMQDPVPRGGGMFRVDRIKLVESEPSPKQFRMIVRFWDKAGLDGKGAYTVGVKMAVDREGRFWILDVVRGQWDASRREEIIRQTAARDGVHVRIGLEQEPGSAGLESAQNTIKNLVGFRVEAKRATGDKVIRADTFASQVNAGNVCMVEAPWNEEFLDELRYFPKSTYKDQVDSCSGGFAMLSRPKIRIGAF